MEQLYKLDMTITIQRAPEKVEVAHRKLLNVKRLLASLYQEIRNLNFLD